MLANFKRKINKWYEYFLLFPGLIPIWEYNVAGKILFKKSGQDLQIISINLQAKKITNGLIKKGHKLCEQMPGHYDLLSHYNQSLIDIYLNSIKLNKSRNILIQYQGEVPGWYRNFMLPIRKKYLFISFIDVTAEMTGVYVDSASGFYNYQYLKWLKENFSAAICINLDNFKWVNQLISFESADLLIVDIANKIKETVSNVDCICIKSGVYDEFFILSRDLTTVIEVIYLAEKILSLINTFKIEGSPLNAAIGIYHNKNNELFSDLVEKAKAAMTRAKRDKSSTNPLVKIKVWDNQIDTDRIRREIVRSRLIEAANNSELSLVYQGIFSLDPFHVVGCEALLRWNSPELGIISPGEFIPIAESDSLITLLGKWVIAQVFELLNTLDPYDNFWISINLTPTEVEMSTTIEIIQEYLEKGITLGNKIAIEVTERKLANNHPSFVRNLKYLSGLNVGLKIDDFGTGSAGLLQLIDFPFQCIKIDRSLLPKSSKDTGLIAVLKSIKTLADELKTDIIAEGIETPEQLDILRNTGIKYGQGYFLGRPCSWDQFRSIFNLKNQ